MRHLSKPSCDTAYLVNVGLELGLGLELGCQLFELEQKEATVFLGLQIRAQCAIKGESHSISFRVFALCNRRLLANLRKIWRSSHFFLRIEPPKHWMPQDLLRFLQKMWLLYWRLSLGIMSNVGFQDMVRTRDQAFNVVFHRVWIWAKYAIECRITPWF